MFMEWMNKKKKINLKTWCVLLAQTYSTQQKAEYSEKRLCLAIKRNVHIDEWLSLNNVQNWNADI